jgi:exonuclease SbcC
MRLKSLRLQNIRSYKDHVIDFEDGVTLFEGDIGSGKSSLLHAIEFAIFGLGDLSGQHLLRVGEHEGKVELELEVNGVPYVFGRTLKRRQKRVAQDTCYLVEDDGKTEYNATSMKKRALQILGFREPVNPRSHSVIFRFAIFTPQEQMRDVIRQRPDSRKETLRKAFGIDEYSIASSNAGIVSSGLRENIAVLEKSEELKRGAQKKIEEEEEREKDTSEALSSAKQQLEEVKREITEINKQIKEKEEKEKDLNKLHTEISVLEQGITQIKRNKEKLEKEVGELEGKIASSKKATKRLKELEPDYRKYIDCKATSLELEPIYSSHTQKESRKSLLQSEIRIQRKNLVNNLRGLKRGLKEKEEEIRKLTEDIQDLDAVSEKAESLEHEISILPEAEKEMQLQREKLQRLSEQLKLQLELETTKRGEWREIESVGVGAECPRCQQQLNETHYNNLKERYETELKQIGDTIIGYENTIKEEKATAETLENKVKELEGKERSLNQLRIRIQNLMSQKSLLERVKSEALRIDENAKETEQLLVNDYFAKETLTEIASIDEELEASKPDVEHYLAAKEELQRLEKAKIDVEYTETKSSAERRLEYEEASEGKKADLDRIEEELDEANVKLEAMNGRYAEEKEVLDELRALRDKKTGKTKLEGELNGSITQLEREIIRIGRSIKDLQEEIEKYEAEIREAEALRLIRVWLNDFFMPTLETIEKNVLLYINQEFNVLFRNWFETLVESGELSAIVDEDFTPIVEQGGYELDVESLSGGEKTSVALAYRLALNTVVKQVTDTMKSNLLILDEPTDGFSRDQLYKMRDILTDLNCDQVIIVSHESELESVADQIYMVTKENGISHVTRSIQ